MFVRSFVVIVAVVLVGGSVGASLDSMGFGTGWIVAASATLGVALTYMLADWVFDGGKQ